MSDIKNLTLEIHFLKCLLYFFEYYKCHASIYRTAVGKIVRFLKQWILWKKCSNQNITTEILGNMEFYSIFQVSGLQNPHSNLGSQNVEIFD